MHLTGNTAFWGGGIFSDQGTADTSDSTLSGNTADDRGGGIYNQGTVNLSDCTLQGNSAANGGGLYNANVLFTDGTFIASRARTSATAP